MSHLFHIDWSARWHEQVEAEQAQYDAVIPPSSQSGDFWGPMAKNFRGARKADGTTARDAFVDFLQARIQSGVQVLDVGSGSGRYAMPMARMGAKVIAIDHSEPMIQTLRQDAEAEGLDIETHISLWEATEVTATEIVVCAHVLYPVKEAEAFLRKLDQHAQKHVYMLMGYEPPIYWLAPYWRIAYGMARIRLPGAIEAVALLHQMGIEATLTPLNVQLEMGFESLEMALSSVQTSLRLPPEPARDARLMDELQQQLVPTKNGFRAKNAPQLAVLSWQEMQ